MAISSSNLLNNKNLKIGAVFTPLLWGMFSIEKFNLFNKWMNGARIFDPTMGEGNLLESLIEYGISKGFKLSKLPVHLLYGNELNTFYYQNALRKFREKFNMDFSKNFSNEDVFNLNTDAFDILFGNPPWENFNDLPQIYKEQIKPVFIQYHLVGNAQNLLLGGSRIDIASLVIQKCMYHHLKTNGEAIFFVPLSLFLNDGAHNYFRNYRVKEMNYSLECIYDFQNELIFPNVATRHGLVHFIRNKRTTYPIPYYIFHADTWEKHYAKPILNPTDPLIVFNEKDVNGFFSIEPILLSRESVPRQGINTCGANHVFIFDSLQSKNEHLALVKNKHIDERLLPKKFIYPLITSRSFKKQIAESEKWILLPYHSDGNILEWNEIQSCKELSDYLLEWKDHLQCRKGTMIQAMIKRGFWWALLGVGKYNFFPYKIVWEAYGKSTFEPKLFEGTWQANQSLQAYIPLKNYEEANCILLQLQNKNIEKYLLSMKMEGTMNWAQPGKIKRLIKFK